MRWLALVVVLAACSKDPKPGPAARPPAPLQAPPVVVPVEVPASPCQAIAARFAARLAAATGVCATDVDCGCYNPVVASAGCGGVTDRASHDELAAIEAEFHKASCPWPVQCAGWACHPRCTSGHCGN